MAAMNHYDAIVIGTGQAGPSLAARFADAGMTVVIVERHKFGGTCVNTGCIPTKTLVASAYAAHVARRGDEYGFANGDVRVDMKRVKARKDAVSGRSNRGVEEWLRGLKNLYRRSRPCPLSVIPYRRRQRRSPRSRQDFHQCWRACFGSRPFPGLMKSVFSRTHR